jgi:hypothetical protein
MPVMASMLQTPGGHEVLTISLQTKENSSDLHYAYGKDWAQITHLP